MIESSQLLTVVAVARTKSFSRAAEDLKVTQSAISQSIKNLEKKVGVKLFKRHGRSVVLTLEGQRIYNLASDFLEKLDHALSKIQENKNTMSGKIRIGTLSGLGKSWVAPRLVDFAEQYPEIRPYIKMGDAKTLVSLFENFELDSLVLPEGDLPQKGRKVLIGNEHIELVFPNDNRFKINEEVSLDELSEFPLIMFEDDDPLFYNWCRKKFNKIPTKVNKKMVTNSHGNLLYAVSKGLGMAVVPSHVLRRSYYKNKITTLGSDSKISNGRLYFIYHEELDSLLRIQKLADFFSKEETGNVIF